MALDINNYFVGSYSIKIIDSNLGWILISKINH